MLGLPSNGHNKQRGATNPSDRRAQLDHWALRRNAVGDAAPVEPMPSVRPVNEDGNSTSRPHVLSLCYDGSMRKLQRAHQASEKRWGFDFEFWDDVAAPQSSLPGIFADSRDPKVDTLVRHLEYVALALAGEVGELANSVKKVRRRLLLREPLSSIDWGPVQEEVADIFAYLLKLCNLMGWDLERLYREKMNKNDDRFRFSRTKGAKPTDPFEGSHLRSRAKRKR
jgi:NTP pyrophosphatase (non-canonical NTP hydrolase)